MCRRHKHHGWKQKFVSEIYESLKEKAKAEGLDTNVERTKAMAQSRKTRRRRRRRSEILTIDNYDIEVVRSFKYLGIVIYNNNDETEEIKTRILASSKAYYPLHTILSSKQSHQNNEIRLYKTIRPVFRSGSVTWALTQRRKVCYTYLKRKYEELYTAQYKRNGTDNVGGTAKFISLQISKYRPN
jgi:hypothetical protein